LSLFLIFHRNPRFSGVRLTPALIFPKFEQINTLLCRNTNWLSLILSLRPSNVRQAHVNRLSPGRISTPPSVRTPVSSVISHKAISSCAFFYSLFPHAIRYPPPLASPGRGVPLRHIERQWFSGHALQIISLVKDPFRFYPPPWCC